MFAMKLLVLVQVLPFPSLLFVALSICRNEEWGLVDLMGDASVFYLILL